MAPSPQATKEEQAQCVANLTSGVMFRYCSPDRLARVCRQMQREEFKRGEILVRQGGDTRKMYLVLEGTVLRTREDDGKKSSSGVMDPGKTIGSLHVLRHEPSHSTDAALTDVVTLSLDSARLKELLVADPELGYEVVFSLSKEVRALSKKTTSSLLEQHHKRSSVLIVSIAASVESFYRSALNSVLNARLTGVRGPLFPNMQVQIPTRMLYINGVKGIRGLLDRHDDEHTTFTRVSSAIAPGLLMTPVSSLLEATNAGHTNPEPLWRRSLRGSIPRAVREIIFGIGINQLSDLCEERVSEFVSNEVAANALGSMTAGVMAGYLSHMPHNLATLKLLYPNKSYWEHFQSLVQQSKAGAAVRNSLPAEGIQGTLGLIGAGVTACVFPKGVTIRTAQIVGSFMVLNGMINLLKNIDFLKIGAV